MTKLCAPLNTFTLSCLKWYNYQHTAHCDYTGNVFIPINNSADGTWSWGHETLEQFLRPFTTNAMTHNVYILRFLHVWDNKNDLTRQIKIMTSYGKWKLYLSKWMMHILNTMTVQKLRELLAYDSCVMIWHGLGHCVYPAAVLNSVLLYFVAVKR